MRNVNFGSVRSKRFRLVSEGRKIDERDFRFGRAGNGTKLQKGQILPTRINNRLIWQQNGNAIWRRESARKGLKSTSGAQYWSSQLFDLRAQSYTDVAVQLLNQPNNMRVMTSQMKQTFDRHMLLIFD